MYKISLIKVLVYMAILFWIAFLYSNIHTLELENKDLKQEISSLTKINNDFKILIDKNNLLIDNKDIALKAIKNKNTEQIKALEKEKEYWKKRYYQLNNINFSENIDEKINSLYFDLYNDIFNGL